MNKNHLTDHPMNMQILSISIALAFLLSGLTQVMRDLGQSPIDRPGWASRPSFFGALVVGITWFTRPVLDAYYSTGQMARAVAFGVFGVLIQLSVFTAYFYGVISLADGWFDNTLVQVGFVAVVFFVSAPIILPIASIVIVPVTLILSFPLDLLFPLKKSNDSEQVEWCRTCIHYKKSKKYEETFDGLWAAEEMPRSDLLPCKIVVEAMDTWSGFYERERGQRALFPKDCSKFERA